EIGAFVQDQIKLTPSLQLSFGLRWDWENYLDDNDNFSPRASLAYAFGKDQRTVIRIGSGFFYDRTSGKWPANLARYSIPSAYSFQVLNPPFPTPFPHGVPPPNIPPNVIRLSSAIRTPYSIQYSFGLERQLTKDATLSA